MHAEKEKSLAVRERQICEHFICEVNGFKRDEVEHSASGTF